MTAERPSWIRDHVPFGARTTLGVGGCARFGAAVRSHDELRATLDWADREGVDWRMHGHGSNTLVADAGYDGLIVEWTPDDAVFDEASDEIVVDAQAGCVWDQLVERAVRADAAGIECLTGIPGTVGAAPIQNIGAYGQELSDVVESVEAWDTRDDRVVRIPASECGFRYRDSRFKSEDAGRFVITSVRLCLRSQGVPTVRYADLQRRLAGRAEQPTLRGVLEVVRAIRRQKSMVLDASDADSRSAGSFFMNPILSRSTFEALQKTSRGRGVGLAVPSYAIGTDRMKVPAAWLIEQAGISRGFTLGRARISSKHTLALVALDGATAADIITLARYVHGRVSEHWKIALWPEPGFVGFDQPIHELIAPNATTKR